jgi:RNA polymerase sigma-70 factor (ECF subfamily)
VSTYLTRIAINLSLNEIKRRKRRFSIFTKEEDGWHKGTSDHSSDLNEMIDYEFGQLDPDFRAVATLRLIEGYSTEETATILGIPLGTVLSRLARAQKKLRSGLEKYLN